MALTDVELIHLGRDNSIDFILYADSAAQDLSGVTEMRLRVGSVVVTSTNSTTGRIRWTGTGFATGEVRIFAAGSVADLSTGRFTASLVVYDATNTNGVLWDDNIPIRVKQNALTT